MACRPTDLVASGFRVPKSVSRMFQLNRVLMVGERCGPARAPGPFVCRRASRFPFMVQLRGTTADLQVRPVGTETPFRFFVFMQPLMLRSLLGRSVFFPHLHLMRKTRCLGCSFGLSSCRGQ